MSEGQKGVLVRSVHPTSFAKGLLVPGDVLLAFDGVDVASGERAGRLGRQHHNAACIGQLIAAAAPHTSRACN
jgi:S1-C subfamily serine protease